MAIVQCPRHPDKEVFPAFEQKVGWKHFRSNFLLCVVAERGHSDTLNDSFKQQLWEYLQLMVLADVVQGIAFLWWYNETRTLTSQLQEW